MIKKLKFFIILFLFFTCSLVLQNNVFAYTHPTMSNEQFNAIKEYYTNNTDYLPVQAGIASNDTYKERIDNFVTSQCVTLFNQKIALYNQDITWDNITVVYCMTGSSTNPASYFAFLVSKKTSNNSNLNFIRIEPENRYDDTLYRCDYYVEIMLNSNNILSAYTATNDYITEKPKKIPTISGDNITITNMEYFLNINTTTKAIYNNTIYDLSDNYITFDENGNVLGNDPVSGDTETSLGYMFYENENVPALGLNLLSNNNFTTNEYWYIGNDLNFNWNYYYLNENEKISISGNNLINLNYANNSGDTGKFYFPTINKNNFSNIPNNTDFYLDFYIYYGNDLIYERTHFYSFYTYKQVIDSGQTGTITITNSSGDTSSGEIDLSGIQSGIGDINSSLTNELNLSGEIISSGDITSSLGFDLATDPYANFWYNLTTGLSTALSTSVRTISITFQNRTYTINLDDYTTKTPTALKIFFATISTFFVLFGLFKFVKLTINKITSGDVDSLLKSNQNEGITNLF